MWIRINAGKSSTGGLGGGLGGGGLGGGGLGGGGLGGCTHKTFQCCDKAESWGLRIVCFRCGPGRSFTGGLGGGLGGGGLGGGGLGGGGLGGCTHKTCHCWDKAESWGLRIVWIRINAGKSSTGGLGGGLGGGGLGGGGLGGGGLGGCTHKTFQCCDKAQSWGLRIVCFRCGPGRSFTGGLGGGLGGGGLGGGGLGGGGLGGCTHKTCHCWDKAESWGLRIIWMRIIAGKSSTGGLGGGVGGGGLGGRGLGGGGLGDCIQRACCSHIRLD